MTTKKKRQRGSRTHGGGSHKNRRGAGNRGGRGNAGREKHEIHGQPPLGKSGFKRPDSIQQKVQAINLKDIDQYVYYNIGVPAEWPQLQIRVSAQDLIDDPDPDAVIKVLGTGRNDDGTPTSDALKTNDGDGVNNLEIVADTFSRTAMNRIEAAGGRAAIKKDIKMSSDEFENMTENTKQYLLDKKRETDDGAMLDDSEIERIISVADQNEELSLTNEILYGNFEHKYKEQGLVPNDIVSIYRYKLISEKCGVPTTKLNRLVEEYFSDIDIKKGEKSDLEKGMPEEITIEKANDFINNQPEAIRKATKNAFEDIDEKSLEDTINDIQKRYLYFARERFVV